MMMAATKSTKLCGLSTATGEDYFCGTNPLCDFIVFFTYRQTRSSTRSVSFTTSNITPLALTGSCCEIKIRLKNSHHTPRACMATHFRTRLPGRRAQFIGLSLIRFSSMTTIYLSSSLRFITHDSTREGREGMPNEGDVKLNELK